MIKLITHLQLKAARNILDLGVRDIAKLLKVSKATISKAELGKTRDFLHKHSAALINFFEANNITFPTDFSIRYHSNKKYLEIDDKINNNITRFQLKAARNLLNLSQNKLAQKLNINRNLVTKAEQLPNEKYILIENQVINLKILNYFQDHNIEFSTPLSIFFKKL